MKAFVMKTTTLPALRLLRHKVSTPRRSLGTRLIYTPRSSQWMPFFSPSVLLWDAQTGMFVPTSPYLETPLQSEPQSTAVPWMQSSHCLWVHMGSKCHEASLLSNRSHSLQGSRAKWPLKAPSNSNGSTTVLCVYLKCSASGKINEIT